MSFPLVWLTSNTYTARESGSKASSYFLTPVCRGPERLAATHEFVPEMQNGLREL